MVPGDSARCRQVYLRVRGRRSYGRHRGYVVWGGGEETGHRHRRFAAVSMLTKLSVWVDCAGSDWALARMVRSKNLFDLSMPAAVYPLQVPSLDLGTFGGGGLNRRGGKLVSHIRIARSESESDVPFGRDGTSRDKYSCQGKLIPIRCPGRQRLCLVST